MAACSSPWQPVAPQSCPPPDPPLRIYVNLTACRIGVMQYPNLTICRLVVLRGAGGMEFCRVLVLEGIGGLEDWSSAGLVPLGTGRHCSCELTRVTLGEVSEYTLCTPAGICQGPCWRTAAAVSPRALCILRISPLRFCQW